MFRKKKLILPLLFLAVLLAGLSVFFVRSKYVVPILMYHAVRNEVPADNRLIVSADAFERQMRFLKENGYNVIALEELAALIRDKKPIPARSIAITFDDGYKDNYTYAFPVLLKYRFPAAIFVIFNQVGTHDKMSWDDIKKMRDSGLITIGSHTMDHYALVDVKEEPELRRQIYGSKSALEEKLGVPVNTFCYPVGAFNPEVKRMVKDAGYACAVSTSPGSDFDNDDTFSLKRLRISSSSDNLFVFWFETTGFYTFIKERRDD